MNKQKQTIYILHQNGAPSHYRALIGPHSKYNVKFYEFEIIRGILYGIKHRNGKKVFKQFSNILFLINIILFISNKTIILGVAPYNYQLFFLILILKKHYLYYHSSWTNWSGGFTPRMGIFDKSSLVKKTWKKFLEQNVEGIFCVSNLTKEQLINNYNISCPIEVVYHSINNILTTDKVKINKESPRILFAARLEEFKGVYEFFELAEYFNQINFTIIGKGPLENYVLEKSELYDNVKFLGYIENKVLLRDIYLSNNILLNLSSKINTKKIKWVELFGISIIEAMASGICVIATNHPGPTEILTNEKNGFLVNENDIFNQTKSIIHRIISDKILFYNIRKGSLNESKKYTKTEIYRKWERVLKKIPNI